MPHKKLLFFLLKSILSKELVLADFLCIAYIAAVYYLMIIKNID